MIGPKKLKTIRQELASVLTANGRDPIRELDDLITAARGRAGKRASGEVLQSLRRFLGKGNKSSRLRRSRSSKTTTGSA